MANQLQVGDRVRFIEGTGCDGAECVVVEVKDGINVRVNVLPLHWYNAASFELIGQEPAYDPKLPRQGFF